MPEVFPVQLVVEVDTSTCDIDSMTGDTISLIAYVSGERQVLASTNLYTGYEAKNQPQECVREWLKELLT